MYTGTIIEEFLENPYILSKLKIVSTKVEAVNDKHQTPWLKQWTLHKVEIPEDQAQAVAETLSETLDSRPHEEGIPKGYWYADFKNAEHHFIIFRNKIFYIDRTSREQYEEAQQYGISLGIPEHQVAFIKNIIERN